MDWLFLVGGIVGGIVIGAAIAIFLVAKFSIYAIRLPW